MAKLSWALLLSAALVGSGSAAGVKKAYIVQMESTPATGERSVSRRSLHENSVRAVASSDSILYSYSEAINGYAAKLTDAEAQKLKDQPDVKSVTVQKTYHLDTTHSPEFLGLGQAALLGRQDTVYTAAAEPAAGDDAEADMIIGVFDSGIWPESESFGDAGLPPVPSRWKGSCVEGDQFTAAHCNNKLIGAKWFSKGVEAAAAADENNAGGKYNYSTAYESARDPDGHGTHTSSIAAGSAVQGVSMFGQAAGTARGMAPRARLAMYKVCWPKYGCPEADLLAAFDEAIKDGINVASLSLGGRPTLGSDTVYTGAFSAMSKGIFVSMSASNNGPAAGTVANNVPWILTVGASEQDRSFLGTVVLGNGQNFTGRSLTVNEDSTLPPFRELPLVLAGAAPNGNITNTTVASLCAYGSLSPAKVAGKIVVCTRGGDIARVIKGQVVKNAGGAGMILINTAAEGENIQADAHVLPAVHIGAADGLAVLEYAKSTDATGGLDIRGATFDTQAPVMAAFSSRGPNYPGPDLLKPDITGPGVEILAAWAENATNFILPEDERRMKYNIISGTSMSCPHLSGVAAFVMARRPGWSVAAIRSALMTTAYTTVKGTDAPMLDQATGKPATPFDYGNGHVDPVAALDPGLVYDNKPEDYVDFVCAYQGTEQLVLDINGNSTCSPNKTYSAYDLNYPSFSVGYNTVTETGPKTVNFTRTVTNVGGAGTYRVNVSISDPALVQVSVRPEELTFAEAGEKKGYVVSVTLAGTSTEADVGRQAWGRLVWSDGSHTVGSSMGFWWDDLDKFAT